MKIREYEPEDLPELMTLFRRSVLEGAARDYNPEQLSAWADAVEQQTWAERLAGQMVAVCEMDECIGGFASMGADGHLDFMFVHPEHLRRGIASMLYSYLETWADAQGIERIYTEASLTAKPLFEKQGFAVIARQTVERNDVTLDNFRMEKWLRKATNP